MVYELRESTSPTGVSASRLRTGPLHAVVLQTGYQEKCILTNLRHNSMIAYTISVYGIVEFAHREAAAEQLLHSRSLQWKPGMSRRPETAIITCTDRPAELAYT